MFVTDEELVAALRAVEDENGVDQRLVAAVNSMTPEERRQSEANVRRWIAATRCSQESRRESLENV
jgi:hypothetical protein